MIPDGGFTASYSICDTSLYSKFKYRTGLWGVLHLSLERRVWLIGRLLGASGIDRFGGFDTWGHSGAKRIAQCTDRTGTCMRVEGDDRNSNGKRCT
jgi:hypothetical protein